MSSTENPEKAAEEVKPEEAAQVCCSHHLLPPFLILRVFGAWH